MQRKGIVLTVRTRRAGALLVALCLVGIGVAAATTEPHTGPAATATAHTEPTATSVRPRASAAPPADSSTVHPAAQGRDALVALAALRVHDSPTMAGYQRDLFGYRAVDLDRNGCDTRNDILRRDLHDVVLKPGTHDCVVLSGTLTDPYSGTTITFTRGTSTSDDVQIDHVVALADAWASGAAAWDQATRYRLGNDPLNLLAVSGPLNTQKSDGNAARWLPPNVAYRCAYVARQIGVKYTYGLTVTTAERTAMAGVLAGCPDQPLPSGSTVPAPAAG